MIKRHTNKDQEEDSLETAKKAVYVLIVAGVVMWLAPELLFDDANTITDGSSDTPDSEIARQVQQFTSDTQIIAKGILDTLKYVLLAATIGAIAFMRIRP